MLQENTATIPLYKGLNTDSNTHMVNVYSQAKRHTKCSAAVTSRDGERRSDGAGREPQSCYCFKLGGTHTGISLKSCMLIVFFVHSTSCEILGWMTHKQESRLLGETSTSDMQMIVL